MTGIELFILFGGCYALYTVGMAREGDFIGLIDLLRQEPCEAAIARQDKAWDRVIRPRNRNERAVENHLDTETNTRLEQ